MGHSGAARPVNPEEPWLQVLGSRYFTAWLAEQNVSVALTTYQTAKLFLIGRQPDDRISVFERTFNRSMGLWGSADSQTLWMSSQYQLWRFENSLSPATTHDGYDRVYIPRAAHTTGDLDIHDVVAI